ncbi:MAG TPA: hypothetical protein VGO41_06210 [Steroidobacteraceae bacterium]|nr:hypothetical protein [Steroidobacteraceae bacterium]
MRPLQAACYVSLSVLLMSCGKPGPLLQAGATPVEQAASNKALAESFGNEFAESTETSLPPSYEVAIASAAADQTRGLEACQEKPAAEQKIC